MKEENNIDKYFREELSNHQAAPSDAVWENINQELGPEDDDVVAAMPWRGIALLCAGLLLFVTGLFCWKTNSHKKEKLALEIQYAEQLALEESINSQQREVDNHHEPIFHAPSKLESNAQESDEYYIKPQNRSSDYERNTEDQEQVDASLVAEEQAQNAWNQLNPGRLSSAISPSLGAGSWSEQGHEPKSDEYSEHADIALLNYTPINISLLENRRNKLVIDSIVPDIDEWPSCDFQGFDDSKWSTGFALYQNNTFRRINAQNPEGNTQRNQLNRAEKPGTSKGARGSLAYALGNGWSLSGGLEYSMWKQEGAYEFPYQFDQSEISINAAIAQATFDSEVTTSTGVSNVELLSNFDAGTLPWEGFEGATPRTASVKVSESITWLSAPISLRYETRHNRLGLEGGAGLSYDRLITNSIISEINSDFEQARTSELQYSRDGFISAHASIGLHYRISESLKISAGPRFKSWLVPLYADEAIKTYPYSGAIEMGLEIKL